MTARESTRQERSRSSTDGHNRHPPTATDQLLSRLSPTTGAGCGDEGD
jgi:hypothetical protein